MIDFSLYQWLILGLLALIAYFVVMAQFTMDRSLEDVTRRIEAALREIREPLAQIEQDVGSIDSAIAAIDRHIND